MRKNRTLKILLVILGCLLFLSSLSACQSPELRDTGEKDTETETAAPEGIQNPVLYEALREGLFFGADMTVINDKVYVHDRLLSIWEKEGNEAMASVNIRVYDIYDFFPFFDDTLYEGKTYGEWENIYRSHETLIQSADEVLSTNPSAEWVMREYEEHYLRMAEAQEMMNTIRKEQSARKNQKMLDLLKSLGYRNARLEGEIVHPGNELRPNDFWTLTEADFLLILFIDPMMTPLTHTIAQLYPQVSPE